MKTSILFLSVLTINIAPVGLAAQPLVSTNEYYHVGDVIQMVNCDVTTVSAGNSGANVTWDFSTVAPTGGTSITTIVHDATPGFSTANLLVTLPNGLKQHVQENNTDSYLVGTSDTVSGTVAYYYNYDISKRPITYLTNYVDTYQVSIPTPMTSGKGYLVTSGDAYGTLMLPSGTYNDVLRVKKLQNEIDTINGTSILSTTTISYLWFDTAHSAPLFRIDSVIGVIGSGNSAMYLSGPTAVKDIHNVASSYQCYLHDNELLVTGSFINGKTYDVTVYNIIGAVIFNSEFIAEGNSERFDITRQVVPGIYIVTVAQKNDPLDKGIIKVIKQ